MKLFKLSLVSLALVASIVSAQAGSIAVTVTATALSVTKSYNLSDAEILRIIAAYQSPANVSLNRTATRQEVMQYWWSQVIANTVSTVQAFEHSAAVSAVVDPTPVNPQ